MRVRLLEDDLWRLMLAFEAGVGQDEAVEATTPPEDHMSDRPKVKTCPLCGRTGAIGAVFYQSNHTYCKACTTQKIYEHVHEVNEATRTTAENHRQPWSELEVEMLLGAVAEGMHARDVAEMLGRTYLAVHGKLQHIRRLLEAGQPVTYIEITTTTTKITVKSQGRETPVCDRCFLLKPCFCEEN